jgi:hypothetical protein
MFYSGIRAEVDEEAKPYASGRKVVEGLGTVPVGKRRHGPRLGDDLRLRGQVPQPPERSTAKTC